MSDAGTNDQNQAEYDLMMELDQLESIKEEMEELKVTNLAEIESRMAELHRKLDELERGL